MTGFADAKVAALLSHRSQLRSTMGIDESADESTVEAQTAAFEHDVHARLIERGTLEGVALGESYKRMDPAS